MKNQKGFIVPLLIAIIAVVVIAGGVYVYKNKKSVSEPVVSNTTLNTQTNVKGNTGPDHTPPKSDSNPKFAISSINPLKTSVGSTVMISGTGFIDESCVYLDNEYLNDDAGNYISPTQMKFLIPATVTTGIHKVHVNQFCHADSPAPNTNSVDLTISSSPEQTTGDISAWITYRDQVTGLEFKYPPNWKLRTLKDGTVDRLIQVFSPESYQVAINGDTDQPTNQFTVRIINQTDSSAQVPGYANFFEFFGDKSGNHPLAQGSETGWVKGGVGDVYRRTVTVFTQPKISIEMSAPFPGFISVENQILYSLVATKAACSGFHCTIQKLY